MAEIEELNPHFRWGPRKSKRRIKRLAKKLVPNKTHAYGCRGHPGLVVAKNYGPGWALGDLFGADVEIRSLVDGGIESCSIFHCAPTVVDREYAIEVAEYTKTHHAADVWIKYNGSSIKDVAALLYQWVSEGRVYYVLSDFEGNTARPSRVLTKADAEDEVERLTTHFKHVTNVRIVDFLTYPAAPTLVSIY